MTFDGIFTKWMMDEVTPQLIGGRITKIHQPLPYDVQFTIRANRKNYLLVCSAHPMMARVQFISEKPENPEVAPNFCMILRKYLEGSIIQSFTQVENDRILHLDVSTRDELGDKAGYRFTIEMMGRHSNLFLVNQEDNTIIDCVKRVSLGQNSYRTLQPGASYVMPPQTQKKNPFEYSLFELDSLLHPFIGEPGERTLMNVFQGISKQSAHEIVERSEREGQSLAEALHHYIEEGNTNIKPTLTRSTDGKTYFLPFPYMSKTGESQNFETLSELLSAYYVQKIQEEKIQQLAGHLLQMLKSELRKNREKMVKLDEDLARTEDADHYRVYGDLINTYQHQIEKVASSVTVQNFYQDYEEVTIPLNPLLTASQNAQAYFKKYQKLRNAVTHIHEQQEATKNEMDYLESVIYQIEEADVFNLEAIREELVESGYLKRSALKKGIKKQGGAKPHVFYATDGTRILVGRNNLQNDQLTLRQAKKEYLWLHAQNIPGSHVIIESSNPAEETIGEGAMLAAYYSKYRLSGTVPVDYVQVSKIRKPNGAKPGFVVYEGQQNTYITPDPLKVEALRNNKPK